MHGGHIEDFPGPHKYRFDDKRRKRTVTVDIMSYVGWSMGAKHWYLTFSVEGNPFWSEVDEGWRECWDDPKAKYKLPAECEPCMNREYLSQMEAFRAADRLTKKHFSKDEFKIMYSRSLRNEKFEKAMKRVTKLDGD